jgi:hypothetical protein
VRVPVARLITLFAQISTARDVQIAIGTEGNLASVVIVSKDGSSRMITRALFGSALLGSLDTLKRTMKPSPLKGSEA